MVLTDEQIEKTVADIIKLRSGTGRPTISNQLVRYLRHNDIEVEFKPEGVTWKRSTESVSDATATGGAGGD